MSGGTDRWDRMREEREALAEPGLPGVSRLQVTWSVGAQGHEGSL